LRPIFSAAALLLSLVVVSSCASNSAGNAAPASSSSSPAGAAQSGASGSATCSYPSDGSAAAKPATAPPASEPKSGTVDVTIALTGGDVKITMDRAKTPCTIGSFVHLATAGYFDNTTCHRLTTTSSLKVLQCGDPSGTGSGTPGYSFADETNASMTYGTGTVAMANAGPNTNGSQFFLVYGDSGLSPDYTVFGHITGGLDVLTKIAAAGVSGGSQDGAPASPITIGTVTVGS
jgi:peptidyl-prolyl cis-trans isomerase B (cyclophilin B)